MTKLRCSGTTWGLDRGVWGLGQDEAKDLAKALRAGDLPVVFGNLAQHRAKVLRFLDQNQARDQALELGDRTRTRTGWGRSRAGAHAWRGCSGVMPSRTCQGQGHGFGGHRRGMAGRGGAG